VGPAPAARPRLLIQAAAFTALAVCGPALAAQSDFGSRAFVTLASVGIVLLCVLLHYEGLGKLTSVLRWLPIQRRPRILVMILTLLVIHVAEIWIFGIGAWWLTRDPAHGALIGPYTLDVLDFIYYSSVCYTTLGLGDLHPMGDIRFLTGVEGLTGFLLIGWSVSFTYFEMERFWRG